MEFSNQQCPCNFWMIPWIGSFHCIKLFLKREILKFSMKIEVISKFLWGGLLLSRLEQVNNIFNIVGVALEILKEKTKTLCKPYFFCMFVMFFMKCDFVSTFQKLILLSRYFLNFLKRMNKNFKWEIGTWCQNWI